MHYMVRFYLVIGTKFHGVNSMVNYSSLSTSSCLPFENIFRNKEGITYIV